MVEKIGKYEVRDKIGVGGFGEVYKGYDPFIKRYVAIKTCSSTDQDIRSRFFQEAEIAGNLHHRNITTVYDFGIQDGLPYLIQEYLSGEDLDRKVKRRDYLPYAEKLYYLLQVARGLGHAHANGVIHRDIKPANIRILEDGTAKIMDFGIAKLAQQETGLTQTGMTLGTAAYLAPEQIRGEDVSLATDVFSFGIMAFELFALERPFQGKQISVVLHQILDKEPPPVSEKWPAAPPEMVAFIDRCLQKDPARRFADGSQLLRELERIQKHGRGPTVDAPEVDDRQTEKLADQGSAAGPPAPPPATRMRNAIPGAESDPRAAAAGRRQPPTIDDIEFSLGGGVEPAATPAAAFARSRTRSVLLPVLALVAAVAVGGGWWLGTQEGGLAELRRSLSGSPSPGPDGPASGEPAADAGSDTTPGPEVESPEVRTPEAESPGGVTPEGAAFEGESPAGGTPDEGSQVAESGITEAGAATAPPPGLESGAGGTPAGEASAPPPPTPAPPAAGTVALERVDWTDRMTVRIAGKDYPLTRAWDVPLPPGTYEAVFEAKIADYPVVQTVKVTVEAGRKQALHSPIPRFGALSVRPLPRRPQGEVWIDGKLLQQSPVREVKQAPGGYRIEIRPVGGAGSPLGEELTIEPGQETVVTFDLDRGELRKTIKPLD